MFISYHVTLYSKILITNIRVIVMLNTIYVLICYMTILLTSVSRLLCLITQISNMGTDQYVWAVLSCDSVYLTIYYTHLNNMGAQHCLHWWITILLFWMNVLLHTSQQYGRSPLCKSLCLTRWLFWLNVLLHTSQQYGCSPLCKHLCVIKSYCTHHSNMGAYLYVKLCVL